MRNELFNAEGTGLVDRALTTKNAVLAIFGSKSGELSNIPPAPPEEGSVKTISSGYLQYLLHCDWAGELFEWVGECCEWVGECCEWAGECCEWAGGCCEWVGG